MGKENVDRILFAFSFGYMNRSTMYGIEKSIAKTELLPMLKISEDVSSPVSNNPHKAMFRLNKKPNKVSQFALLVGSDLVKARMNMGATIIAASQEGMNLLALVDMKRPNPRMNHTNGK